MMGLPLALRNTMPLTFIIRVFGSQGVSGAPTYSSTFTARGRIEPATEKDIREQGFERGPMHKVILDTTTLFDERGELEFPPGLGQTKPKMKRVKRVVDTRFLPHTVVFY